jgi:hypothetical protein
MATNPYRFMLVSMSRGMIAGLPPDMRRTVAIRSGSPLCFLVLKLERGSAPGSWKLTPELEGAGLTFFETMKDVRDAIRLFWDADGPAVDLVQVYEETTK